MLTPGNIHFCHHWFKEWPGAKPFLEPMIINHGLEPNGQIFCKIPTSSLTRKQCKSMSILGCQISADIPEEEPHFPGCYKAHSPLQRISIKGSAEI